MEAPLGVRGTASRHHAARGHLHRCREPLFRWSGYAVRALRAGLARVPVAVEGTARLTRGEFLEVCRRNLFQRQVKLGADLC